MKRVCRMLLCALICALLAAGCAADQGQRTDPQTLSEAIMNSREVVAAIRTGLREYSSRITISFTYDANILDELSALTGEWIEAALRETDNPREGDYIRYQYGGYESTCRYEAGNGRYFYTVEIIPDYYIYYVQEQEASARLAEVYGELALDGDADDYEKIRAIYGYVCSHVRYDKVHQKNPHYHAKSTAYAALVRHTATCQGYCVLLYRMLRENGIDCRIVTGTGVDEAGERLHAWNIVALDGNYYNLDATWDAGTEEYRFFLRGSESFENHTVGEAFTTDEFINCYPIASEDYCAMGQATEWK